MDEDADQQTDQSKGDECDKLGVVNAFRHMTGDGFTSTPILFGIEEVAGSAIAKIIARDQLEGSKFAFGRPAILQPYTKPCIIWEKLGRSQLLRVQPRNLRDFLREGQV